MKLPFVDWVVDQFNANPVVTAIVGLILVAMLLYLLSKAAKVFYTVVGIAIVAIIVSYFVQGPEKTNELLKDTAIQAKEKIDELSGEEEPPTEPVVDENE